MASISLLQPDPTIISKQKELIREMRKILSSDSLISDFVGRRVYNTDAFMGYSRVPLAVVLPRTTKDIVRVVNFCRENGIKLIPRGAGTSVSGCAVPYEDAVVLCVSRMNQILEIDYDNRFVTAQSGITNIAISQAVAGEGFFYAPDPSSQLACTLAGNIGTNAGGARCLKYGVTSQNILGMKFVTIDGKIIEVGGAFYNPMGYDISALMIGSEGQLGIVSEVTVRILPKPECSRPMLLGFASHESAGACVSSIIRSGLMPAAIEFMDQAAIQAAENYVTSGYPMHVEALLIIELEGDSDEIDKQMTMLQDISHEHFPIFTKISTSDAEAEAIWKGRKAAYSALGRFADIYVVDGTIPTGQLAQVLPEIIKICEAYDLLVANLFHAGDGNLHPLLLYNANDADEFTRAEKAVAKILELCVEAGGSLSGEHGIGLEKRDLMPLQFDQNGLEQQKRIKDAFDEQWLLNPGKVFPLA